MARSPSESYKVAYNALDSFNEGIQESGGPMAAVSCLVGPLSTRSGHLLSSNRGEPDGEAASAVGYLGAAPDSLSFHDHRRAETRPARRWTCFFLRTWITGTGR